MATVSLALGNLGHLTTFHPLLTTFPSSRFRIALFLPFGDWSDVDQHFQFAGVVHTHHGCKLAGTSLDTESRAQLFKSWMVLFTG